VSNHLPNRFGSAHRKAWQCMETHCTASNSIAKQRDKASALSGRFDLMESLGIALKRKDAHGSEMIFG
jgi:hypothetical protein